MNRCVAMVAPASMAARAVSPSAPVCPIAAMAPASTMTPIASIAPGNSGAIVTMAILPSPTARMRATSWDAGERSVSGLWAPQ